MRKFLSRVVVAVFMVLPITLSAQRYENGLADKSIVLIGNEVIFLSQLESEIQIMAAQGQGTDRNTRCQTLENMMVHMYFLLKCQLSHLKN